VSFVILSGGSTLLFRGEMDSFSSHPQVLYDDGISPKNRIAVNKILTSVGKTR
jgi:hypothetical protein